MNFRNTALLHVVILIISVSQRVSAQDNDQQLLRQLAENTSFSGQWFLIYNIKESGGEYENMFSLRRGYITFTKKFNDIFSVRFTQDIVLDEEGSDAGNIEMRLKYCLLHIDNGFMPVMKNSWWEVGLINRPLFGFEDKINDYRVQAPMFLDKYDVLSSADFGISFSGLIGGEVNEGFRKGVSSSFPGRLGSYSLGLYNGGGYHATEVNSNKVFEGRFTLRPLGDRLPGLQMSYSFATGKGNTPSMPDFSFSHIYLSWQSRPLVLAGQFYTGRGNGGGTLTNASGLPYRNNGCSFFGELKIVPSSWALMTRVDRHTVYSETTADFSSLTAGVCYRFLGASKILLNTDIRRGEGAVTRIYEAAIEIRF